MQHRIDVRLTAAERALIAELQAALATSLLPTVTASDVIRAGLRSLAASLQNQAVIKAGGVER